MKDISHKLTQEQKESIYQYFADWVLNDKPVKFNNDSETGGCYFIDGDIEYKSTLNLFNIKELGSILVSNDKKDVYMIVSASEIRNYYIVDKITKFILTNKLLNNKLTDNEFFDITNICNDKSLLRNIKISKIKDNL